MCYPIKYVKLTEICLEKFLNTIYFDQKHLLTSFNKKPNKQEYCLSLKWMAKRIIIAKYFVED